MAITRSLFIFTMAMSVFHNPSDDEIGGRVQPALRLPAQGLSLRLGGPADLVPFGLCSDLRLPEQLPAPVRRRSPRLL